MSKHVTIGRPVQKKMVTEANPPPLPLEPPLNLKPLHLFQKLIP